MAAISGANVKHVVVACEAGMGSSVMVAKALAKQLKETGITVSHTPVNQLAGEPHDVVLCHRGLGGRAKQAVPNSVVIMFDMFLGDFRIAQLVSDLKEGNEIVGD